jgi:hypothetical protein
MKHKSQGGIEFLIVSGAVMFFFVIFFVAIQKNTEEKNKEKELLIVQNLALSVQDEISLASESTSGYERKFNIPTKISNQDYDIMLVEGSIYIKTSRNALSLQVNEVTGQIKKEENIIKNENGKVYLNPPTP